MNNIELEQRIKKTMSVIFDTDIESINEQSSPETLEKWDSLGHMNLVVALEEEFNLQLTEEQMLQIMDYKMIVELLTKIV